MSLFVTTITAEVKKLHKKNVCVQFIGDRTRFSEKLQASINESEALTRDNTGLHLNIAANYGGRWDIVQAARAAIIDVQAGRLRPEELDEQRFASYLSLPDVPDPDLFIRTGGEMRVSNFLLWNLAYTELVFQDCLWPDFNEDNLRAAMASFAGRERRFGEVLDPAEAG